MIRKFYPVFLLISALLTFSHLSAQTAKKPPRYNSLLWEITGNGLEKPSYLFGTMHVSSKMVFHLSDSFYHAIRNSDMVALELNPKYWQPDMFRMQDAEQALTSYFKDARTGYINEKSFRLQRYEDAIRMALSEEPTVINGLLYRNMQQQADFEENTYLDLYIYQTGRKLGKQSGGVEDYWETQKVIMEGYQDMAIERAKKKKGDYGYDFDGDENYYEVQKKLQEAYRKGDLDLLDSLEKKLEMSPAFNEKFLYKRNEIQANSIDSILKKQSLFVGVGAAHLPGERGVIELLRKKGYRLRPIMMQNRDALQKEKIDKLHVPVKFNPVHTADGFVKMMMPGELFKRSERNDNPSWQYADMENGSYYMLTRVPTHAAMLGENEAMVLRKVDSLLYENIPGKILSRNSIERNGYKGFDITNRTRRGDIQRYNIFVTPFEVLVFKMSGNDDYVQGKEAAEFFSSISMEELTPKPQVFETGTGGFRMELPHTPFALQRRTSEDFLDTWQYEAVDKSTGKAYMVWKKTIPNYGFIEEDTFDLSLVEESLKGSEFIDKQESRSFSQVGGYPALDMLFSLKDGGTLRARAMIRGPHYYLVASTTPKKREGKDLVSTFAVTGFKQESPASFVDSFYSFRVNTPFQPSLNPELRKMLEAAASEEFINQTEYYSYGEKRRSATFYNDSTGESAVVTVTRFPKYYFSRDTARFFENEYPVDALEADMVLRSRETLRPTGNSFGYKYVFTDTNSSRKLVYAAILQHNRLFDIIAVTDTLSGNNDFVTEFIRSFVPQASDTTSVFQSKLDRFFADLNSKDSLTRKRAMDAAAQLYFGPKSIPRLKSVIDSLKWG
ncbi:MAG TPA: TraB/GumN family protein, partial [Chitinophagaceae bacterium]